MADQDNRLCPLPYHQALADYLERAEPDSWRWFASAQERKDFAEEIRLELLKRSYRLEPAAHPELFAAMTEAQTKLTPGVPVTLYQSQQARGYNVSIFCLPGEAHIVIEGNVVQLLDAAELRGVFGHELAHYRLWQESSGRFFLTDRIAQAMAVEPRAASSHVESARLLRLYTEIYADRGAFAVTGATGPVISGLVKLETGLTHVDPVSYGRQADEIFARAKVRTEGVNHPETFIRTRAIRLWADGEEKTDAEIRRMIEGPASLDKLDLLGQERFTEWTRRWLHLLLRPAWFQTDAVGAPARLLFPEFTFAPETHTDDALVADLAGSPIGVRDYFCYLLLDFAAVDPDLEDEPLKAAHLLAQKLEWDDRLEALSIKELKLKKRDAKRIHEEAVGPASAPREASP
jgi:hypothetical protein